MGIIAALHELAMSYLVIACSAQENKKLLKQKHHIMLTTQICKCNEIIISDVLYKIYIQFAGG